MRFYIAISALLLLTMPAMAQIRTCDIVTANNGQARPRCEDPNTLYKGKCSPGQSSNDEFWCEWPDEDVTVCCAPSSEDCCELNAKWIWSIAVFVLIVAALACSIFLVARLLLWMRSRRLPDRMPQLGEPDYARGLPMQQRRATAQEQREFQSKLTQHIEKLRASGRGPSDEVSKEDKECIVCFDLPRKITLPCGHSQVCERCAKTLLAQRKPCPTCRVPFNVFGTVSGPLPTFRDLSDLMQPTEDHGLQRHHTIPADERSAQSRARLSESTEASATEGQPSIPPPASDDDIDDDGHSQPDDEEPSEHQDEHHSASDDDHVTSRNDDTHGSDASPDGGSDDDHTAHQNDTETPQNQGEEISCSSETSLS